MKRNILLCVVSLAILVPTFPQTAVTLDAALNNSTSYLKDKLSAKSKVVVLNFTSKWPDLSEYIIEELIGYIVNEGTFTVVDRANLETIRQEMNFQLSGEVSDKTAQSVGKKLGAQVIISGSMTAIGNTYRLRIRAIAVETAEILGMQNVDVTQDSRLAALTGTAYTAPTANRNTSSGKAASASGNTIPSESVVVFAGNGHKYEVIVSSKNWSAARQDCEKQGGYLATITSAEEQQFIEDLLSKQGRDYYWLGGYYAGDKWQWVTGESFVYTNGVGQATGGRNRLVIMRRSTTKIAGSRVGSWINSPTENYQDWGPFGYICEWD